ncbi:MAG: FKBP-type peptidyl-prolyl cis-trans isomerase [Actinobacteria bacterium]|nr:FKBP-type peptidyl-prolyl cis-trans isomerase [Actinomycetota bacterium]
MPRSIALVLAVVLVLSSCSGSDESSAECAEEPVESETGLRYEDLSCGSGAEAAGGTSITIEYTAELADGTEYASSEDQDGQLVFPLGRGQVINGLDEGVRSMKVGGTRRLTIPPDLAYGDAGFPPYVGPDETVVYEVTLLEVAGD